MSVKTLQKVQQYLIEIKKRCDKANMKLDRVEFIDTLQIVQETKKILQEKNRNMKSTMANPDELQLVSTCCEIIMIFAKYIITNGDRPKEKLKSASLIKEGLLSAVVTPEFSRVFQFTLLLLKRTYLQRFDKEINTLMRHKNFNEDEKSLLEDLRIDFYKKRNILEYHESLKNLAKNHKGIIADKINILIGIVKSYQHIDEEYNLIIQYNKPTNSLNEKPFFITSQAQKMFKPSEGVKNLIQKFNKIV